MVLTRFVKLTFRNDLSSIFKVPLVHTYRHIPHRTQEGDPEAFSPLVVKYQPRIYNHILGHVKNAETAKDLTQETWLRAFRALKTFRGDSAFASWLYRIAENVCIDYFRKQKHDTEPLHAIDECRITETHPDPC